MFTSSFVLSELASLLSKRAGASFAVARLKSIYNSSFFTIIHTNVVHDLLALEVMEKYSDLPLSFTDASSLVLMREYAIEKVFSFDNDFRVAGYQIFE